ncbi:MAG: BolA family transcriptional regulator [Gammaproteobacteria bacterium]|nr:BolA family transcriptional regulator [Gammaproteobacteria bacterium]
MEMKDRIISNVTNAINPSKIEVINESHLHAGHLDTDRDDTHFRVKAVAEIFETLSAVKRHQMVYGALSMEFEDGLHALALELKAPSDD